MNASAIRQRIRKERLASGNHSQQAQLCDEQEHKVAVFGYSAKIHPPLTTDDSPRLIEVEADQTTMLIDRYDVRNLLLEPYSTNTPLYSLPDPHLHTTRFEMLSNASIPEHELFQIDPIKRRMYIENIEVTGVPEDPTASEHTDTASDSSVEKEGFKPSFAVPPDMTVPSSKRHFEIIERTAKLIAQQSAERAQQMEILIQGKQATNRDFDFLNRSHPLHPFYKHLVWLLTTNLVAYDSDESSSSLDQPTGSPTIVVPKDLYVPKDPQKRRLIDTVARWVARSSGDLELKIKTEKGNDDAYSFLSLGDQCNQYYGFRRKCLADGFNEADIDNAVAQVMASED
ncbi:hypothetical protein EV183_000490 [Coemansia sp. RSA 2336]|nr:hypothetical protein EV183_000490 [Coemansia sp. RSA 2336]